MIFVSVVSIQSNMECSGSGVTLTDGPPSILHYKQRKVAFLPVREQADRYCKSKTCVHPIPFKGSSPHID